MIKIINFCHTRPSSSSSPHYLSFFLRFILLCHIFLLYLVHYLISLFFSSTYISLQSSCFSLVLSFHRLIIPFLHVLIIILLLRHLIFLHIFLFPIITPLFLVHNFFSYLHLEISIVFFSFILHLLPLSTCPLFLLLSRSPQLTDTQDSPTCTTTNQLLR